MKPLIRSIAQFSLLSLVIALALGINYLSAWSGPPGSFPTCPAGTTGCDAPVNVGGTGQIKTGGLTVGGAGGGLSVLASAYIQNNLGLGVPSPVEKLEVSGNVKLSGASNGVIFQDGTKQTTAAAGGVSAIGSLPIAGGSASIATSFSGVELLGEGYTTNNGSTLFSHHTQVYVANISGTWSYVATIDGSPSSGTLASGVQKCVSGTPTICMTRTVANALQLTASPGGSASGGGFIYQVFN